MSDVTYLTLTLHSLLFSLRQTGLKPDWVSSEAGRPDLVLARHYDVLRRRGGRACLDLQRVCLQPRVSVGAEEAVVLLHAQRGPGQLAPGVVHREGPTTHRHTLDLSGLFIYTWDISGDNSGVIESLMFITYESRRVLYSKTPEIKCAANLGKKTSS